METLKKDPEIAKLIEEHGNLELERHENPFERLVISIVNQQLSTQSAAAIRDRLFENFKVDPEALLDAEPGELNDIGLSRQKIEYIKEAAKTFIEDDLSLGKFEEMSDQEVMDELIQIKGVGDWTAKMFLMFVLGREDVFPVEDLGIRNAMTKAYGFKDRDDMVAKAEEWKPYRSLAALYLWKLVD